ncbi:5'-nucleotidase C-terminal domain-containing protein [Ilyomonas limi]|nr:5'-nucleotidase [Ilyomonas limi]
MYKKQPANDSTINIKTYNNQHLNAYADSTDTSKVIGFAIAPLYKKQPESPLGNLMADCMKLYAEKLYNKNVDAAFVNFSGMRAYIPKGDITIGTIFKVMPYDNKIVLLSIQGNIFRQFLDHQASLGGWPCSGISMTIKDKQAIDIQINNQPLEDTKTYTVAVADYIANGGNQCTMFKGLLQLNKNHLFRTALIDYIASFTKAGKPVTATIENRIVYRN